MAQGGPSGGSELKVCPICNVLIVKMNEGSCNHMTCTVCGSLYEQNLSPRLLNDIRSVFSNKDCGISLLDDIVFNHKNMRNISLLYLTIFTILGWTFWGKKPSSIEKKLVWQLGTQGAQVPVVMGIPVCVGRMA